ncbi:TPA: RDD family protein [Vibrio alginolyticus]|uniref:RDD family protein n=1 Tax=Vibrio TaxID=662 RepID=UPI0006CA8F74|nr:MULTISPECIES: RDD family protein [Vibrio]EGQ8469792.1 RDD family protein [Vibrio alginolyticus]EGR1570544.1 RDD family protein [Vibrio alginolyticus]EJL6748886.1 RDD family protein [Vibrio alginolyticus]EJL6855587.1 RDD family protein [Vibrio alginolyticus]EJL8713907.1 RDD family protein [Vibrio alginolyticus]
MYAFIASKQQRIIAGFIDLLFAMVVVLIIALSINSFLNDFQLSLADNLTLVRETQAFYLLSLPMVLMINWNALSHGQTIGMRMIGIKVVMKNDSKATKVTAGLRLVISYLLEMLIPGIPLVNLALLFFHPERRLLHDLIANTKVVQAS